MALSAIKYESINDEYSYGKYGDFKVIMMNSNSCINATKLCNEYNKSKLDKESNKEFIHWKENKSSRELILYVDNHIQSHQNSDGIMNRLNF